MQMRLSFRTALFVVVYALLGLSVARLVNAAEWSAQPSVRLGRGYNDNVRLTIYPHPNVMSSLLAPKLDLAVTSDIWQVTGSMEAVQNRFSGDSSLNSDNLFYNLASSYRTERSIWQVVGSMSQSSILYNQQVNPETGVNQVQYVQDAYNISPSWTWQVDELSQLQLTYSLSNASYVNGMSVGLYDYSTRAATATFSKMLDPNDTAFVSAGYSIFNVPVNADVLTGAVAVSSSGAYLTALNSKSTTYQAGITRTFSETSQITLSAGIRNTSYEQDGYEPVLSGATESCLYFFFGLRQVPCQRVAMFSKQSGTVFNVKYDEQLLENYSFHLTLNRSLDSSGTGGQVQTDSIALSLDHPFTSRLRGSFAASSYTHSVETGNISGVDTRLYYIQPSLEWQWTEKLLLDASYIRTHIRRVSDDQPAISNAVNLTLTYAWPRMEISR